MEVVAMIGLTWKCFYDKAGTKQLLRVVIEIVMLL